MINVHNVVAPHLGRINIIELNRPSARNAISRQMLDELAEAIDDIHRSVDNMWKHPSDQVRALIITSSSDAAFCAGADLKERKSMTVAETRRFLSKLRVTFARLEALSVPTIACVAGIALGGGLELALSCHLRVFAGNASVGLPETRIAIIPGAGGTYRLQEVVGRSHALDMILTGRRVGAAEAARIGLCNRVVDGVSESCSAGGGVDSGTVGGRLLTAGVELAREIARGGPVAIRAALAAVCAGSEDAEDAAYEMVLRTQDRVVALKQFGTVGSLVFTGE